MILATGSRSFVPRISGFGAGGSGVLRTAADAMDLRAFAQRVGSQRAVVAGGGLLGLEAAYALHKLGLRTVVLERSASLLRRQLDARAGDMLRHYLEGLGIEILLNAEVGLVEAGSRLRAVHLQDERRIEAQIILVAAGIQPNVDLAQDAKLEINRGLVVDDRMRSSDPAILAAGDVAEFEGQVPGLWPTAVAQAEVAAENAVGGDKAYVPVIPATILKVVGIELTSIGRIEAAAGRGGDRARGRGRRPLPQARDRRGQDRRRDPARPRQRRRRRADRDHARLRRQHAPGHAARGPLGDPGRAQRRPAARTRRGGVVE